MANLNGVCANWRFCAMSEYVPVRGMQRILLLCLALAFVVMMSVSLWQRIKQPDLVLPSHHSPQSAATARMEIISHLMQKLQQNPDSVGIMIHLAEHLMEDNNWTAAENFLRRAVVTAPDNPRPLYLLGVVLHNQGNHAEATAFLERVVSLLDEPPVRYSLGILYIHFLQDSVRGGEHLRAALAMPELPEGMAVMIRTELDELAAQGAP
jgi:cytochrome c-type biogenesis protein CcmH/NrfG